MLNQMLLIIMLSSLFFFCSILFCLSPAAYAPAPTFSYRFRINESNIELNSIVEFACGTTWSAPYPVTVSVGKLESPSQTPETTEAWVTSEVIRRSDIIYFTIPATAKYEGKIVCWYKSTRTDSKNPYSELSSPITLVACKFYYAYDYILMYYVLDIFYWNVTLFLSLSFPAALSHPKVTVHPNLFRKGENYTVQCESAYNLATNFTLSLYYRILPVTPDTNWTFAGSLFLTNYTSIVLRQTNAVVPIEFACSMEMLYNGKVLHSSLSKSEQAIPGTEEQCIPFYVEIGVFMSVVSLIKWNCIRYIYQIWEFSFHLCLEETIGIWFVIQVKCVCIFSSLVLH